MPFNNSVNSNQTGVQCLTSAGVWNGRTITAGTGISVTNGDGVSGNPTIAWTGSVTPTPSTSTVFFDDFLMAGNWTTGTTIISAQGWKAVNQTGVSSAASWFPGTSTSTNAGIITISASSASPTSNALINATNGSVNYGSTNLALGGGAFTYETLVSLNATSVLNQDYICCFGIGDISDGATEASNGVYFYYTRTTNSGQWVGKTASGGSRNSVNSSVAASTSWVKFAFTVNAAASSVEFFINGASIGTQTLTIPTSALGYYYQMTQTSGANTKTLSIDYILSTLTFTTPR